jgi:hypothetical protein
VDLESVAEMTDGYSGSDMKVLFCALWLFSIEKGLETYHNDPCMCNTLSHS